MKRKEISDYYALSLKRCSHPTLPYTVTLDIHDSALFHDRHAVHLPNLSDALSLIDGVHNEIGYICTLYYAYMGIPETSESIMLLVISRMH